LKLANDEVAKLRTTNYKLGLRLKALDNTEENPINFQVYWECGRQYASMKFQFDYRYSQDSMYYLYAYFGLKSNWFINEINIFI